MRTMLRMDRPVSMAGIELVHRGGGLSRGDVISAPFGRGIAQLAALAAGWRLVRESSATSRGETPSPDFGQALRTKRAPLREARDSLKPLKGRGNGLHAVGAALSVSQRARWKMPLLPHLTAAGFCSGAGLAPGAGAAGTGAGCRRDRRHGRGCGRRRRDRDRLRGGRLRNGGGASPARHRRGRAAWANASASAHRRGHTIPSRDNWCRARRRRAWLPPACRARDSFPTSRSSASGVCVVV